MTGNDVPDHRNKLNQETQEFVYQRLLEGNSYRQVIEALLAQFGVQVSLSTIQHHAHSEAFEQRLAARNQELQARTGRHPLATRLGRALRNVQVLERLLDALEQPGADAFKGYPEKVRAAMALEDQIRKDLDQEPVTAMRVEVSDRIRQRIRKLTTPALERLLTHLEVRRDDGNGD